MKNRIIGVLLCIAVLAASFAAAVFVSQKPHRVHQHIEAQEKAECTGHGSDVFCTHLPLVQIETDEEIPGRPILNENGGRIAYTTSKYGTDRIPAQLKITDHKNTNNHLDDNATLSSKATIRIHGHSSRYFDKPSYKIKLIDENGNGNDQSVMGMDAHSEWLLHGPYLDKSLIRNYMWYNIGGEMMSYAPNVRFCEVFINGNYEGVYLMTETVTAGKNGARLQLSVDKKDSTYTGYLLRQDRTSEEDINNFTNYAYRMSEAHGLNIEYPGAKNITPELTTQITKDFSDFEKSIYSYDFDSEDFGYKTTIDVDSFVSYFIINEFTCNNDAGAYSTYIYKDKDRRFRMCIWDFNNACDNYQEQAMDIEGMRLINTPRFWMLIKDEDFTQRIIERYKYFRTNVLSDEYLNKYIDDTVAYLGDAIDRNNERWASSFKDDELLIPKERNIHSYDAAIDQLKSFIRQRSEFLDENIDSLAQYSKESRIKKFEENAN